MAEETPIKIAYIRLRVKPPKRRSPQQKLRSRMYYRRNRVRIMMKRRRYLRAHRTLLKNRKMFRRFKPTWLRKKKLLPFKPHILKVKVPKMKHGHRSKKHW